MARLKATLYQAPYCICPTKGDTPHLLTHPSQMCVDHNNETSGHPYHDLVFELR